MQICTLIKILAQVVTLPLQLSNKSHSMLSNDFIPLKASSSDVTQLISIVFFKIDFAGQGFIY